MASWLASQGGISGAVPKTTTKRQAGKATAASLRRTKQSHLNVDLSKDPSARIAVMPDGSAYIVAVIGEGVDATIRVPEAAVADLWTRLRVWRVTAKRIEWAQRRAGGVGDVDAWRGESDRAGAGVEGQERMRKARLAATLAAERAERAANGQGPPPRAKGRKYAAVASAADLEARGIVPGATVGAVHRQRWGYRGVVVRYAVAPGYRCREAVWGVWVEWGFGRRYAEPAGSVFAVR